MSLKAKLEAVIYAAEEPVTLAQLAALFSADALAWKEEQAAASAAVSNELADQGFTGEPDSHVPTQTETLPLLSGELLSPEAEAGSSAGGPEQVMQAPAALETSPESGVEVNGASQAGTAPGEEAPASGEAPAAPDLQRQARLRDREVRAVIRQLLDELTVTYASDDRGIEIREIAGGYRMGTKPEYHDGVRSFVKSLKPPLKLSLPALETLAVIAYKQPVTAPEVNEIRGVDSSAVFGSLLARKLIATAGRKPVIGRPILYKTTREFLLRFGLKDVSELPSMEEFEKMAAMELDDPGSPLERQPAAEQISESQPEFDETNSAESAFDTNIDSQETPKPNQTAEMADSHASSTDAEATPAAPAESKQAETENSPHGEEDQ